MDDFSKPKAAAKMVPHKESEKEMRRVERAVKRAEAVTGAGKEDDSATKGGGEE